jgi:hypothetical protein
MKTMANIRNIDLSSEFSGFYIFMNGDYTRIVLRSIYPWAKRRGVNLTTQFHLVPRSRMVEIYHHSTIRLNGVVLN